ncbi:hypothetical protein HA402_005934 [Bradysia odoriphaga]|nr:hypothetical protein HA402_005934 [Bradysia odoriphaga]
MIVVVQPHREVIDRDWNSLTRHTAWEKVELDHLLSWLSTLGGAFSALGDSKTNCAEIAGKISFYQLKLGLQFGDPLIVARSKLFVSLSLIQRGRLRLAKRIIRQQYEVAKVEEEYDPRLRKMCVGIWMKLQYAYQQRSENRKSIRKEICNKSVASV